MLRRLRFLPTLGLLLLLHGTSGGANEPAQGPAPNFYPMQVGNTWTFAVTANDKKATSVNKIARTEMVGGKALAVLELSINGKVVATEHLLQNADGVFRYRNNTEDIKPPLCLLKYPLQGNAKWGGDVTVGTEKAKYTAEAREEAVQVPAGKYKALRVDIKMTTDNGAQTVKTTYWFAQGVGIVKQTIDLPNLALRQELEKFSPAKK
jgi:hypothetical protein